VGELDRLAGLDRVGNPLVDGRLDRVGHEQAHDIPRRGGFPRGHNGEPVVFGGRPRSRVAPESNHNIDAGVGEVLCVCMALASVADDGDSPICDNRPVGVSVGVNRRAERAAGRGVVSVFAFVVGSAFLFLFCLR
jgi:hypothetical protein